MENLPVRSDEISLRELINKSKEWCSYLLSKWKIIIVAAIIGAFLGVTYSSIKKPIYVASLSFALEDDKSSGGLGSALGLVGSLGLDLGGDGGSVFTGPNLTELFKSRSMVEKTLLRPVIVKGKVISLAEMYIQNSRWRNSWKETPQFSSIKFLPDSKRKNFTRVHDSILGVIYQNLSNGGLTVEQKDKKISIITLEMSSQDELFSKYFTEALTKEVSDFYIITKSKKARMNMAILEKQTDSIRRELNQAITGVAVANDNTFNLNPALNVRRTPYVRKQVDVQANTAILTELVKQTELAKVTLRKDTPLIQIIDRPILPLKKEGISKFKGFLLGFFLFGFGAVFYISLKKYFNN